MMRLTLSLLMNNVYATRSVAVTHLPPSNSPLTTPSPLQCARHQNRLKITAINSLDVTNAQRRPKGCHHTCFSGRPSNGPCSHRTECGSRQVQVKVRCSCEPAILFLCAAISLLLADVLTMRQQKINATSDNVVIRHCLVLDGDWFFSAAFQPRVTFCVDCLPCIH